MLIFNNQFLLLDSVTDGCMEHYEFFSSYSGFYKQRWFIHWSDGDGALLLGINNFSMLLVQIVLPSPINKFKKNKEEFIFAI